MPVCRGAKKVIMTIGVIILCSVLTIIAHAVLPAKVDVNRFDSTLIKQFGFPAVATIYFITLYTQCSISLMLLIKKNYCAGCAAGFYSGLAYALMYIVGMQEIMIDVSPFEEWGFGFINYQVFMGLGDAIPVIMLCTVVSRIFYGKCIKYEKAENERKYSILLFTLIIGSVRTFVSYIGLIRNSINIYPIAVLIWNYVFGCIVGVCYKLIDKKYIAREKMMVFGVSVNWIIFNMFIGMIKKGAMYDALLRSCIDALVILIIVIAMKRKKTTR